MNFTLKNVPYLDGTTVYAYDATGWPSGFPGANPPGDPVEEAEASNHSVQFSEVEDGVPYIAAGKVGGQWRYVKFEPDAESASALKEHEDATEDVHGIPDTADVVAKTWRESKDYTIPDFLKVAAEEGDVDFIPPFIVALAEGQTAKIVAVRHKLNSGTKATVKLTKNGEDLEGFTGIEVTAEQAETDPDDQSVADGDRIGLVVESVEGEPKNLSFSVVIEHTT